ncbi:MAG: NAD-dependent epimerase/dehydratase family protein [Chloroflexota bacterium]|nr:NAD-dependent epimerase/dehydratase family protein [Dehalococcoidia bacterium]MDW8252661.1 NAD-dependent epimerase/dehydratase family protein [Chloroflexota bacterium]
MEISACLVPRASSLAAAMTAIERAQTGLALVVNTDGALVGVLSDGDIRRAIIAGAHPHDPIERFLTADVLALPAAAAVDQRRALGEHPSFLARRPRWIPLLDERGHPRGLLPRAEVEPRAAAVPEPPPLITVFGGAGYIGSVLVRQLLDDGYRVRVFDHVYYDKTSLADVAAHPRFEMVVGDVRHSDEVVPALVGADAVVHLAELVGDPLCAHDPLMTLQINYLATATLVLACRYLQLNRFVYISSCSVYGASADPDAILTEESPLSPVSLYAKLKIEAERVIAQHLHDAFAPCILRLGTVFGLSPRPRFDLVVNTLTAQAVNERAIAVFGGDQWRPHVHVSDVARAIRCCLLLPLETVRGEVFNIVTENLTVDQVAALVAEEVPGTVINRSETTVDRRNYRVSSEKARRVLGFDPRISVREGIREIAAALRSGAITNYADPRYSNILAFTTKGGA